MLVDDLPEPGRVGVVGHALEDQRGRAIGEWSVHDVAVPGDPTDIGGAPIDFALTIVEHVFVRHRSIDEVAAGGVQYSFRLSGRARSVEDEERVLSRHFLRRAIGRGGGADFVVPEVAALYPVDLAAGVTYDDDVPYLGAVPQRVVGIALKRDRTTPAAALIGGDQHARAAILYPANKAIG